MLPAPRPVDPDWSCQREGSCCRVPPFVVMTHAERRTVELAASVTARDAVLGWEADPTDGFVRLLAGPCPLYAEHQGLGQCRVYTYRPYNCRRFGCMRPDVKAEPFDGLNMSDRVKTSRIARRLAEKLQRKAQRWARIHGWKDDAHATA